MQVGGRWRGEERADALDPSHGGGPTSGRVAMAMRGRPALPSGRALIGGFLVAVAMVLAFTVASSPSHGDRRQIVVARRALPVGHRIESDDLRTEAADLDDAVAGDLFTTASQATGSLTLVPIPSDGLVPRSAVVRDGASGAPGREFSFPVDRERAVNGRLQPGEVVDVVVTYGTGEGARTMVVAPGVQLLAVEDAGKATLGSSGKVVVTVRLSDAAQLLQTAHASEVGAVTLVRATGAPPSGDISAYATPRGEGDDGGPVP